MCWTNTWQITFYGLVRGVLLNENWNSPARKTGSGAYGLFACPLLLLNWELLQLPHYHNCIVLDTPSKTAPRYMLLKWWVAFLLLQLVLNSRKLADAMIFETSVCTIWLHTPSYLWHLTIGTHLGSHLDWWIVLISHSIVPWRIATTRHLPWMTNVMISFLRHWEQLELCT